MNTTPQHWYTVYDDLTDDVLASGTARECAALLGIKRQSFYRYVTRANGRGPYDAHTRLAIVVEPFREEDDGQD